MKPIEIEVPDELMHRWEKYRDAMQNSGHAETPKQSKAANASVEEAAQAVSDYVDELIKEVLIYKHHAGRNIQWIKIQAL